MAGALAARMRDFDFKGERREQERNNDSAPAGSDLRARALHMRMLQRKAKRDQAQAPNAEGAVEKAAQSSGQPLPGAMKERFQRSLGQDLSDVRVHTGGESNRASDAVAARAYTSGNDIHFAAGQYDPASESGQHLLAHEVAHTVQQSKGGASLQRKPMVSQAGDAHEVEADRAADDMLAGREAKVSPASGMIQRDAWDGTPTMNEGAGFHMDAPEERLPNDFTKNVHSADWNNLATSFWTSERPETSIHIDRTPPQPAGPFDGPDWKYYSDLNTSSYQSLDSVASTIETSWSAMAPNIIEFNSAQEAMKDGGALGPAPTGENWNEVSGGANSYDEAANEQIVGDHTQLKDLFGKDGGLTGVDQKSVDAGSKHNKVEVSKLFEKARVADSAVDSANQQYYQHINGTLVEKANLIKMAVNSQGMKAQEKEKEKAEGEKSEAAENKEAAKGLIEKGIGWLTKIGKVAVVPEEEVAETSIDVAMEMGSEVFESASGVAANAILGGQWDQQIEKANEEIEKASAMIEKLGDENLALAVQNAMLEFRQAVAEIKEKKSAIQTALATRHDAYAAAAQAAGEKAAKGGGKKGESQGERIRAAIDAIPKVQTVLGRIDAVLSNIQIPQYNDDAGWQVGVQLDIEKRGQKPNFDIHALAKYNKELKVYKEKFDGFKGEWEAKAKSLEGLMMQFNVKGS